VALPGKSVVGLAFVALALLVPPPAVAQFPGGLLELATSADVRPRLTQAQLTALLPARGLFTFPAPYLTQGVRLTNPSDCDGNDCVNSVGDAHWRNTNNHVGSETILIFLTLDKNRGGSGPTLFSYNKVTDALTKVGPLFDPASPYGWATGEGWYFSATRPTTLYLNDGPRLLRYDVVTRTFETVLDVSTQPTLFGENRMIWQAHSSDDDRVHSATLRDGATFAKLGCLVYREDTRQFAYFPQTGPFYDACQLDTSGQWLLIKEKLGTDPASEVDNRIIDLVTGVETDLLDRHGAGGNSDNGSGYVVASDNWHRLPGAIRLWKFGTTPLGPGTVVYHDGSCTSPGPQHVSHANTRSGVPPEQQYACSSRASSANGPRANEVICFLLDGSLRVLVVAPVMTDVNAVGGGDGDAKLPKGNLDVTGQYFIWTSNMGGSRLDAFLVKVPAQRLTERLPDAVAVSNGAPPPICGLAALYPGDVGIETHSDVIFAEHFEEATLTALFTQWTDVLGDSAMAFSSDVPPGSPGSRSLTISGGGATHGGSLYKQFSPGVDDTLYVRYYIKYPTSGLYQHDGIWIGGYNPPLPYPSPQAGVKPVGNDRFVAAAEQSDDLTRFDHYDYWMNMRVGGDGNYWGNSLLNDAHVRSTPGQWMCVEHMVKLNNPVTAFNGEHAIWLDGVKVSHLGQDFPNGRWSWGRFTQDPTGSPFEGFRWRSDANLNLNYIWLQNYAPTAPAGDITFDHVVVAKSYIGCLVPASSDTTPPTVSISAPAEGSTVSGTVTVSASAADNVGVVSVQFQLDGANLGAEDTAAPYTVAWNTTAVPNGAHTLTAVARDAAGNSTTSAGIRVIVNVDSTPPTVAITSPTSGSTYSTPTALLTLAGTASDNLAVTQVTWSNSRGGSGTATGTTSWTASGIVLQAGTNALTVTARDAADNAATATLTVTVDTTLPTLDATPPTVAITSPTSGSTYSTPTSPLTLAGTASDNLAVSQVTWTNSRGGSGTATGTTSWTASGIVLQPGMNVLTVTARDAAGNTATATLTVTLSATPEAGMIFDSSWDTAVGPSRTAVTDGGRWPHYWEFNNGTGLQLLSVVPGGPNGHNALRVQQRGTLAAAQLQINDVTPLSTDFYVRYYMMNDDTSSSGDHVVTVDSREYWNLTFTRKYSSASNWRFVISLYGCGYIYPIGHWGPTVRLSHGQWYRFEYYVHYTSANRVRVYPRIYDAAGNLILSDSDFWQENPGGAVWNGRRDWTLASYYAAGFDFCVNPSAETVLGGHNMTNFSLGNNGQASAADTGLSWYFAGVQLRTDTWPGPVSPGAVPLTFSDDPLVVQSTRSKAYHIAELRAAIDRVRVARGLAPFAWTDPGLKPRRTPIKAIHVLELRTALNHAYEAAGRTLAAYTDSTLAAGQTMKAVHLNELRTAVRALDDMPIPGQ
jgi:hypothetical protein